MSKLKILIIVLFLSIQAFSQTHNGLKVIKSNTKKISIQVNGELNPNCWTVSPEISEDIYYAECSNTNNRIIFRTDVDSLQTTIKIKDSVSFYIFYDNQYALTKIKGIKPRLKPATFSQEYISEHKDKQYVEITEVKELMMIIISLTDCAINKQKYLTNKSSSYSKKVFEHFHKFAKEPIIQKINVLLNNDKFYNLILYSYCYEFKGNKIKNKGIYNYIVEFDTINPIRPLLTELEGFARKTKFRDFYRNHEEYYDALIASMNKYCPVRKQWDWLESHFPRKVQCYKVEFSPLSQGKHCTIGFSDKFSTESEGINYLECLMFIRPVEIDTAQSDNINEAINTNLLFSEIDHNYINPLDYGFKAKIDSIFSNKRIWAKGKETEHYPAPTDLFNEYMTWAVYCLYALDNFDKDGQVRAIELIESDMNKRGFCKIKEINLKLMELYTKSSDKQIFKLYPEFLDWCKIQK